MIFSSVICEKTTSESLNYIQLGKKIAEEKGIPLNIIWQKRPYFGGAVIDGFMAAQGSHVCMVTPDLDTAPEKLSEMIALAKIYPDDIILGSRWRKGGGFVRYSKVKKIWNWSSQQFLRLLYISNLSDFTWGNQLAPTILYQSINYQELKHPFNVEKVVIPLRLGIKFHEVPAICRMPEDNETVNPLWANLGYLRPAIRWRFAPLKSLLKKDMDYKILMQLLHDK